VFAYPIYNHNWRNISTIYIYNKTSIKRNILTIKQNISGSRSGQGLISTPVQEETEAALLFQQLFIRRDSTNDYLGCSQFVEILHWMTDSLFVEILELTEWLTEWLNDWMTWLCMLVLSVYLPPLSKNSHFRKNPSVNSEHLRLAGHCWGNPNLTTSSRTIVSLHKTLATQILLTVHTCVLLTQQKHENQIICGKDNSAVLFIQPGRYTCSNKTNLTFLRQYKLANARRPVYLTAFLVA
jgi:hypothetical protein